MAINVSQAFHRTSANPVDDTLTLTKAQMLAVNDNLMPSKYLTICQDDGFIYLYDKSATPNQTTGKFTKFEGGGGGTTDYDDLTDKPQIAGVTLSGNKSLSDLGITKSGLGLGSVLNTGDSATPTSGGTTKFTTGGAYTELAKKQDKLTASTNITIDANNNISATMPTLGIVNRSDLYDTTEKVIGKWTDGKPIYQKVLTITSGITAGGISIFSHGISNLDTLVSAECWGYLNGIGGWQMFPSGITDASPDVASGMYATLFSGIYKSNASVNANKVCVYIGSGFTGTNAFTKLNFIFRYTKTTDAANSYNYADENDYSTSEKIIGTWIDGKPIYQKVFTTTIPTVSTDGEQQSVNIPMGVNVSSFMPDSVGMLIYNGTSFIGNFISLSASPTVTFTQSPTISNHTHLLAMVQIVYRDNSHSSNKNTITVLNSKVSFSGCAVKIVARYTKV